MQNRCPGWFQKLPNVSPVPLQAPLLLYRIPLPVPALHLKEVTAPLLNLETTNQSWPEAEAISSLLQIQLTCMEGKAAAEVQTSLASLPLLPGEGTRTNQAGNNPDIR